MLIKPLIKQLLTYSIFSFMLFGLSACNSESHVSILNKCTTLGDEAIVYARANYVKLFHHFNPKKFQTTYQQIEAFDYVKHRNVINTYDMAVRKLKAKDSTTKALVTACKELAKFSKNLVDQAYPRAISHSSKHGPSSDQFFIEINQIVKFDHSIGVFDKSTLSFKHKVKAYQLAVKEYKEKFKPEVSPKDLQSGFVEMRVTRRD